MHKASYASNKSFAVLEVNCINNSMCGYCVREYIVDFFSRTRRRATYHHFIKRRRKRWYKHTHTHTQAQATRVRTCYKRLRRRIYSIYSLRSTFTVYNEKKQCSKQWEEVTNELQHQLEDRLVILSIFIFRICFVFP
jgi:hypothetical protein